MAQAKISACKAARVLRQFRREVSKSQKVVNMGTRQSSKINAFNQNGVFTRDRHMDSRDAGEKS